jgi:hypothetical protein
MRTFGNPVKAKFAESPCPRTWVKKGYSSLIVLRKLLTSDHGFMLSTTMKRG